MQGLLDCREKVDLTLAALEVVLLYILSELIVECFVSVGFLFRLKPFTLLIVPVLSDLLLLVLLIIELFP